MGTGDLVKEISDRNMPVGYSRSNSGKLSIGNLSGRNNSSLTLPNSAINSESAWAARSVKIKGLVATLNPNRENKQEVLFDFIAYGAEIF